MFIVKKSSWKALYSFEPNPICRNQITNEVEDINILYFDTFYG